jgi:uncharacterized protein involved in exopolysaccharide biosynthesis
MSDNTDEIDLIELLKKIYLEKKLILKISVLAALFGVVYALFQPNEFTSSTTFIPQLSSGVKTGGSSLSGLASLAGINIGSMESSSEFPPTLYPQVVNGVPFRVELLSNEVTFNNELVAVKDYLEKKSSLNIIGTLKKYTIGLPSLILSSFNNQNKPLDEIEIYSISKEDEALFKVINNSLSLSINEKEGFITISFTDTNKNVAAQVTQIAQNLLQEKIIEFKNKSSKEMLDFALKQYSDKKDAYEKLQDERAVFVDKNINISSSLFQNKLSRIESEVNILESIVQQLASQVEQAKLQVNKSVIVIVFAFIGLVLSSGFVLVKEPVKEILKYIRS